MSEYFIGIDSGTQSTKTILLDAASGEVVASASESYELIEGLPAGPQGAASGGMDRRRARRRQSRAR